MLDHPRLVVGDVLELVIRRHVAEGEDAARGGALELVDHDLPFASPRRRQLGVEQIAVGYAPGRDQQHIGAHGRPSWQSIDAVADLLASADYVAWLRHLPFLGRDVGEPLAHVVVVAAQQRAAADHDVTRLPSAEKMCANSRGDESAPDDDQMFGQVRIRMMVSLV